MTITPPDTTTTPTPQPKPGTTENRERARQAFELRARGQTWAKIADTLNYSSPAAAYKAVQKHANKRPPERIDTNRKLSIHNRHNAIEYLWALAKAAGSAGRYADAANVVSRIVDAQDKLDRITGVAMAPLTEITVNVGGSSAVAIIEQAEQQLLALASARPTPPAALENGPEPIDAEIIDQEDTP
jgi:hypothetical protein